MNFPRFWLGGARLGRRPRLVERTRARWRPPCAAAPESPYDVLGVTRKATEKEIKSAYRRLALKYHPDVNKAPDAEVRFLRIKEAYQALTNPSDGRRRTQTAGSAGGGRSTAEAQGGPWSSPFDWMAGGGKSQPQEEFYGFGEFFRDLEKDLESRRRAGKSKSLWEELAEVGEEFVEFLEKGLSDLEETEARQGSKGPVAAPGAGTGRSGSNEQSARGKSGAAGSSSGRKDGHGANDREELEAEIAKELDKLKRDLGL